MASVYRAVLLLHILCGVVGFAAFWVPALARKGGRVHTGAGRLFFRATCGVVLTGVIMATLLLIDPIATRLPHITSLESAAAAASRIRVTSVFLFYLLLITFAPVHHGVRVLATRRNPPALRTRFHTSLNVATIAGSACLIVAGIAARQPVFLFMSPIGFLIGFGNLRFARQPHPTPMAWWYEHMGSMLGGGIAFHTAFLVLGAGRLFGLQLDGMAAVVPWLLPTLIGVPGSEIWIRYYKKKFNEMPRVVTSQLPTANSQSSQSRPT